MRFGAEQPVEAYLDEDRSTTPGTEDEAAGAQPDATSEPAAETPRTKPARKRGRASVPSWDEIMFGGGKGD